MNLQARDQGPSTSPRIPAQPDVSAPPPAGGAVVTACSGLVLGRVTYEFFRANWGAPTGDPYTDQINAIPKYVASRTLSEVTWNATLLGPDIVGAIEQLKAQPGKDLFKMGTGRVDDTLLRARFVDQLRLWVMPVVVGTGQRLFEDVDTASLELTLTDVRKLANSSVILTYVPS